MIWLPLLSYLFGGAFLANAMPHSVSGMMGQHFQSPFTRPPEQGLSSSTVNVIWGFINIVAGYILVCRVGAFDLKGTDDVVALGSGVLSMALILASQFGRLHGGRFHGGNTPDGR